MFWWLKLAQNVKIMSKRNKIPDGWRDYTPVGKCISGTRIIPLKVPLRENMCQRNLPRDEWFTPDMLIKQEPKLKTIIDLTNTDRYYNGAREFGTKGIAHVKISVEGQGKLPPAGKIQQFQQVVDEYLDKNKDNDALIGVHCTHGLNRTGYFVCSWMLDRLKIDPEEAIRRFNEARGHKIERKMLLDDLRTKSTEKS
ncbi:RNA/RNP complex-1-interacting phosphatase [Sitophilus oryzae]|uniref:RNA/RNP complex-1-interacting phosphatase n=1 Tax=Sitophilus oryzae TaxID=7048 RepID=A0A6J2XFP4_SITOR|nr:RNA/RNP complex-1-interacting phosphatase [Sitophilus oryzae]